MKGLTPKDLAKYSRWRLKIELKQRDPQTGDGNWYTRTMHRIDEFLGFTSTYWRKITEDDYVNFWIANFKTGKR